MEKKFVFDGVHPASVEGRFFKARLTTNKEKKLLSIEEFKLNIRLKGYDKCPQLYAEYKIPLPDDIYKRPGQRILGNPLCIGSHNLYILLQYVTQNEPLIQFLIVDIERSLAQTCKMTCCHFMREYVLTSPLECYLDTDIPFCLIRLSQPMLKVHRSLAIQSVVFQSSKQLSSADIPENALRSIAESMTGFKDITSVKDSRFLCLIPLEHSKFILVTVDQFCIKFIFDMLDACTLASTRVATREVLSNCSLLQCKACKTRSQDIICVACLTEHSEDDFTSAQMLHIYIFELPTFEYVTTYFYNCSKSFGAAKIDSGEIMMTVSNCDTKVEIWFAKRQCHPIFIKSFRLCRQYVTSLKSQCRSTILQHTNVWDIEHLKLPKHLVQYLEYQ